MMTFISNKVMALMMEIFEDKVWLSWP